MIHVGLAAAATAALASSTLEAASDEIPAGAATLRELIDRLAKSPRRRDFKSVPMILDNASLWDSEALSEVMTYTGRPCQAYDNTEIDGSWLNVMRNALNAQIWSFNHPDFLVVSATHGSAHLALFDQEMWDKYQLTKLAGEKFKTNTLIQPAKEFAKSASYQDPDGQFSPHNNSITALRARGVVFMACHNAIWEISEKLIRARINPDKLSHDMIAAELTNHLISGAVLTPGIVATLPELQRAGFFYIK